MPIVTAEQRPPRVTAVQFDGTNADEVAAVMELPTVPEVQHDDAGAFVEVPIGVWGSLARLNPPSWLVRSGPMMYVVLTPEEWETAYRVTT